MFACIRTYDVMAIAFIAVGTVAARDASAGPCDLTQMAFCTFAGNDNGFWDFGDTGTLISFETLPDGNPSFGGANITPAFNYVMQGAMFTSPFPGLKVVGNSQLGYALAAFTSNPLAQNSITALLTNLERGVGVRVIDHTTLFAYDAQGSLIASVSYFIPNVEFFLGIKSNTPIFRVVVDRNSNSVSLDDFTMIHVPAPEPASGIPLVLAALLFLRRPSRRAGM